MASTYELIQSYEVGAGGASSIDFTVIPATYTDLVLMVSSRPDSSGSADISVAFNNDTTASNYPSRRLLGTGSSPVSDTQTFSQLRDEAPTYTANTFSNNTLYIPNYTGSNYKSHSGDGVSENNSTQAIQMMTATNWNNTAAITSIKVKNYSGSNFVQYTTAYLYGVKNA